MIKNNDPADWLLVAAVMSCMSVALVPAFLRTPKKTEPPAVADDKVVISTKETYFHARVRPKYALPVAVIALFFVGFILFRFDNRLLALFTFISCLMPISFPLLDMKIKEVAIAGDQLCVSNFSRTVLVPLSEIKEIAPANFRGGYVYLVVKFASRTAFGKTIYFRPVNVDEIGKILERFGVRLKGVS